MQLISRSLCHLALLYLSISALGGCTGAGSTIAETLLYTTGRFKPVPAVTLNPNYAYLRVTVQGRVVYLARGYMDEDPEGPLEVWYSAEKEVIRLQNGRLAGATGLTTEWRNVSLPRFASWATLAQEGKPFNWTRSRDVMPGYRFGIQERLSIAVVPAPARNSLQGLDPQSLTWFEEAVVSGNTPQGADKLPAARYAVHASDKGETVLYGEQCLTRDFCFAWQRWPPKPDGVRAGK